jgi:hypothetical protein
MVEQLNLFNKPGAPAKAHPSEPSSSLIGLSMKGEFLVPILHTYLMQPHVTGLHTRLRAEPTTFLPYILVVTSYIYAK